MTQKQVCFLIFFLGAGLIVNAQQYVGVFESNDQQLYVVQSDSLQPAVLIQIDSFKEPTDIPNVQEVIGAVYSQLYRRTFAVYENIEGEIVAHAIELSENGALEVEVSFGVVFEPNYYSYFGVVLNTSNQLIAFRATY